MTTVQEILKTKGSEVWSVSPTISVSEALRIMADRNVGALIVTEKDRVLGVVSERDYARKIALLGQPSQTTLVRDIMTSPAKVVSLNATAEECMRLMTDKRIRHLPVIESSKLVGVISIGDIVKSIISEQQGVIENLKDYITGKYL